MIPLPTDLRRLLEKKVVEARDAAEEAARGALRSLAVDRSEPFPSMTEAQRLLRRQLRARARQLGSFAEPFADSAGFDLLASEIAYEQWHRMLFARFLAENDLLMHPTHGVTVTLEECADLAESEGEPDKWMLAARYASQMLPGIFRTDDPTLKVRFAPEGRQALERILDDLPASLFTADDSLGWVYQFWQSKKKKEVNASERKIGGADLPPVTQLFTEHYMVAFLLENSLGAWWAGKHPGSPLLKDWEYLRFAKDGTPAAGTFEGWPTTAAEVTMMDPCCGSGHFLVAGFEMLRKMREEEESLSPQQAADAVLRDNLFGLELDGRCVQIAVFALALAAWKVGGYRELPPMNIACSGVPARGKVEEWRKLAGGDARLADALERLYHLFKDADTLGSLIDPRRAAEADTLLGVDYDEVAPLLHEALSRYGGDDPAQQVFAQAAEDVATAARLLAGQYTLVATNPPYLGRGSQDERLMSFLLRFHEDQKSDLAMAVLGRFALSENVTAAMVLPEPLLLAASFAALRNRLLNGVRFGMLAGLGSRAFEALSGEVVRAVLLVADKAAPSEEAVVHWVDVAEARGVVEKANALRKAPVMKTPQSSYSRLPAQIMPLAELSGSALLHEAARATEGMSTGDAARYARCFWELSILGKDWSFFQGPPNEPGELKGCSLCVFWEQGSGTLASDPAARVQGHFAWGKPGVLVGRMDRIRAVGFLGGLYDKSCVVITPADSAILPAVLAYSTSDVYSDNVRTVDRRLSASTQSLVNVPFDLEHWTKVAAEKYPNGLPEPHSEDPTQWLFKGNIVGSESPLHVAVARLLGYHWPDQEPDELDRFADPDGIVCLPPIGGERPAADRLLELLAAAYGDRWNHSVLAGLLAPEGSPDLESWLRDKFFASHCKLFGNRPFIWHIWDGRKDGFSALVNYHKLDRKLLDRLIYTTLQAWIDRQKAGVERGDGGAEARLAAAEELKGKLQLIAEGEPPYDIYVRWKPLSEQPTGWEPDINDGVRLNVRPFVTAGVLRSKFNVKWQKDRGKNPDGSERLNDLHYTIAEKRAARGGSA
jgi:hypothetical protein